MTVATVRFLMSRFLVLLPVLVLFLVACSNVTPIDPGCLNGGSTCDGKPAEAPEDDEVGCTGEACAPSTRDHGCDGFKEVWRYEGTPGASPAFGGVADPEGNTWLFECTPCPSKTGSGMCNEAEEDCSHCVPDDRIRCELVALDGQGGVRVRVALPPWHLNRNIECQGSGFSGLSLIGENLVVAMVGGDLELRSRADGSLVATGDPGCGYRVIRLGALPGGDILRLINRTVLDDSHLLSRCGAQGCTPLPPGQKGQVDALPHAGGLFVSWRESYAPISTLRFQRLDGTVVWSRQEYGALLGYQGDQVFVSSGTELRALSIRTGRELWRVPVNPVEHHWYWPGGIHQRAPLAVLANDRQRWIVDGVEHAVGGLGAVVRALDPATGAERWRRDYSEARLVLEPFLAASGQVALGLEDPSGRRLVVLSEDGAEQSSCSLPDDGGLHMQVALHDGRLVFLHSGSGAWTVRAYSAPTLSTAPGEWVVGNGSFARDYRPTQGSTPSGAGVTDG